MDGAGTEDNGAQPMDELTAQNPDVDVAMKNLVKRASERACPTFQCEVAWVTSARGNMGIVAGEITLDHENVARGFLKGIGLDPFIGERKQSPDIAHTGYFNAFIILSCTPNTRSS